MNDSGFLGGWEVNWEKEKKGMAAVVLNALAVVDALELRAPALVAPPLHPNLKYDAPKA